MTAQPPVPPFDHFDADFMRDPYPGYAALRAECPVHHSDRHGGFFVLSRLAEVEYAAQHYDVFSSDGDALAIPPNAARPLPITVDPPEHRRYRSVMAAYFSPRRIERMEPEVRALTNELIDSFIARGACEISAELTSAVPTIMLARMLGVPLEHTDRFHHWVDSIIYDIAGDPAVSAQAAAELQAYVVDLVTSPRALDDDTFVAVLQRGPADGPPYTVDEQVRMVVQLIFGALHTTSYLINGALLLLDDDREVRARLVADPRLMEGAVEEFLRMVAPVQGIARKVTADVECFGQRFAQGDRVMLLFASACRDEDEFDDAATMRIDRAPNRHAAFGIGMHRCVGAPLGRLQTRVVLEELLRRMPDYAIPHRDRVVWGASSTRGIIRLPVEWPVRTP